MSHETQIVVLCALFLGFAYFWAYPRITEPTGMKLLWRDAIIALAALMVGAVQFAGANLWFSIGPLETRWWLFQIVVLSMIETPLFLWFAWKHNLEF